MSEAQVIHKLKLIICVKNSPYDWTSESDRSFLLEEHVPPHLHHRFSNIIRQLDLIYQRYLVLHLKEAEERFCIIINGDSGVQKTKLAEELIIPRLAEKGVIMSPHNYAMWEEQDLTDKLERLDNKEVVILDDYSGENHKLGILNKLTSSIRYSKIRVMGDHFTTRYIKGVIIPTVDSVETWITHKTGTLRKFIQITRRTTVSSTFSGPIRGNQTTQNTQLGKTTMVRSSMLAMLNSESMIP